MSGVVRGARRGTGEEAAKVRIPDLSTAAGFKRHLSSQVQTEVFDSPIAGKGLRTLGRLAAGQVVGFYGGTYFESMEAWEASGRKDPRYLFSPGNGWVIDGKRSRFGKVNHCCEPNLTVAPVVLGSDVTIMFIAMRHVKAGEELTFDYNIRPSEDGVADKSKWVCRCGAGGCRGWMYAKEVL